MSRTVAPERARGQRLHRLLWASNWPRSSVRPKVPDDVELLELLLDWAPDEATRRKILVGNPADLYCF